MATVIYQAVNLINGKRYIGMTAKALSLRALQHKIAARNGATFPFASAIRKYGADMFRFSVLAVFLSRDDAAANERRLIALLLPEYNAAPGGEGLAFWTGKTRSKETKEKISITKKGCAAPPVTEKMRATRRANCRKASDARSRRVVCVNDDREFPSAASASASYGLSRQTVNRICAGERAQAYGLCFRWRQP